MTEHKCFTVSPTSCDIPPVDERIAIYFQAPPKLNPDGSMKSMSWNFPVMVLTPWVADGKKMADEIAAILNENIERFMGE